MKKHGIDTDRYSEWRDEDVLRELRVKQDLSVNDIAEKAGCSYKTVWRWLDEFGIEADQYSDAPWRDEDRLRKEYIVENKTMAEIADEWDCSRHTISKWAKRHELPTRERDPQ
jgi:transposase-like protein